MFVKNLEWASENEMKSNATKCYVLPVEQKKQQKNKQKNKQTKKNQKKQHYLYVPIWQRVPTVVSNQTRVPLPTSPHRLEPALYQTTLILVWTYLMIYIEYWQALPINKETKLN